MMPPLVLSTSPSFTSGILPPFLTQLSIVIRQALKRDEGSKLHALGEVCYVALSYCIVLPCVVFLSISWMIKVMYIRHVHMYMSTSTIVP